MSIGSDNDPVEVALNALMEIAQMSEEELSGAVNIYEKRSAAEEILRHYREERVFSKLLVDGLTININGHVPVKPLMTAPTLVQTGPEYHDDQTMTKVHDALRESGFLTDDIPGVISRFQNAGILFRERR